MKIAARQDIAAPAARAYAHVADFAKFEKAARARGAKLRRLDGGGYPPQPGATWHLAFRFRGRQRQLELRLATITAPDGYVTDLVSDSLEGQVDIALDPLAPDRCRLRVAIELRPKTLAGRLLIQSMKLARGRMRSRLQERLAEVAAALAIPPVTTPGQGDQRRDPV